MKNIVLYKFGSGEINGNDNYISILPDCWLVKAFLQNWKCLNRGCSAQVLYCTIN